MCPSRVTYLSTDCLNVLALQYNNNPSVLVYYKVDIISSNVANARHDISKTFAQKDTSLLGD